LADFFERRPVLRLFGKRPFHLPNGIGRAGLLILALLAVAAAAGACGGGDGDSDKQAEQVIGKFLEIGQNPGATAEVMIGKLPADLPPGLPDYPGASLVGSTVSNDAGQEGISVLSETADPLDNVALFYEDALDQAPWQVLSSNLQEGLAVLQFSKSDDPNFVGGVIIQSSNDKKRCTILLSVQVSGEAPSPQPFELGASKPLPRGFPAEMPLYPGMTVIHTGWGRSGDTTVFQYDFLAKSSPQDVIAFYRNEFQSRGGWTITEKPSQGTAVSFSFEHKEGDQTWSGSISADKFAEDPTYTQASLQLRIGPPITPTPPPPSP
jgi:hypothetical protein